MGCITATSWLFLQHGERLAAANEEGAAQEAPGGIDKSELAIAVPKRVRHHAHRRFVASQPCLICGRTPSQAHHLRFAQPRALGRKVSDEWTVPLCVLHHRALDDFGAEKDWCQQSGVDALAEAQKLLQKSRGQPQQPELLPGPSETTSPPESAPSATAKPPEAKVGSRRQLAGRARRRGLQEGGIH